MIASIARGASAFLRAKTTASPVGAAANPKSVFRANPPGTPPRTLAQALALARSEGVEWDDADIEFRLARYPLGAGVYASYFGLDVAQSEGRTPVIELQKLTAEDGQVVALISPTTLGSDDAIVATIAHEVHEITKLRGHFDANGGRLTAKVVYSLVNTETGTLHCEAWDLADKLVTKRQAKILKNQSVLNKILANQKAILANQKTILAGHE